ncbi:MAG: AEC family transporter [Lachnospiraceae bacterium]|nr:AEC family transporter [Lachnospiraceae bacterium]
MSIFIVQKQMIIIFVLILIGVFLFKSKHLSNDSARQLSWIIVNITNPITLLCAALSDDQKVGAKEVGLAFICFGIMYAYLIILAYIIPPLLGIEKDKRYSYRMLTIFGNTGFIGIPFAAAVLGTSSLIFVSVCGFVINMIVYTYGSATLRKTAAIQNPGNDMGNVFSIKNVINSGTVISVITIVVYLLDVKVPEAVHTTLNHIGTCTTFLSMIVLGVSVAQIIPREIFTKWRLYIFIVIRQILVPILLIFILRLFVTNTLLLSSVIVMVSMPAGNLPLMMSKQYGVKEDTISAGIIMTTLASIITIPVVMSFL